MEKQKQKPRYRHKKYDGDIYVGHYEEFDIYVVNGESELLLRWSGAPDSCDSLPIGEVDVNEDPWPVALHLYKEMQGEG